jgi:predicted permease
MDFYESLLWCYPRCFRERFGADMRRAFALEMAALQSKHPAVRAGFLVITAIQAIWFGTLERFPKGPLMRSFFQFDIRAAYRSLRATPVVTAIALASLALGIGANTALFSILNGLVLKPLPVREPERLVYIDDGSWTNAIWEEIRPEAARIFDGGFAWAGTGFNLADRGQRDQVTGAFASGDVFRVLGINAVLGRTFTPADDVRVGGPDGAVAVISDRLWKQRFGASPAVIGQSLSIDRTPFKIIGVLPAGFFGVDVGRVADIIVPLADHGILRGKDSMLDNRSAWWMEIYARRKPDQTIDQATLALRGIQAGVRERAMPQDWDAKNKESFLKEPLTLVSAATGQSGLRSRYQEPLTIVMAVVFAVLLIACANIANLLLSRATARRHELSLRLALGASKYRIGRQLFTESLLLAAAGAALGLLVAKWGSALLVNQLATSVNRVTIDLAIDWRVLGFTAGTAVATTLLFGLAPAFGIAGVSPNDALKEQSRSVAGDRKYGLRTALVVTQLALSLVLVVGAGLFVRTFSTLTTAPLGFDPSHLEIVNVTMGAGATDDDLRMELSHRFGEAAARSAGVERAAISLFSPMSGVAWNTRTSVRDGVAVSGKQSEAFINGVGPGWFDTYGMRLIAGRDFSPADSVNGQKVAVVNETFVKRFIGDGVPAIGRVILDSAKPGQNVPDDVVIVGVVNDSIYRSVRQGIVATIFRPFDQMGPFGIQVPVTVRLPRNASADVERGIAAALSQVDPQATFSFRPYNDMLRGLLAPERITAILSAFFGGLALLLAGLGLYGVTSYSVNRRRSEIAVRMALGATAQGVVRTVMSRVSAMVLVGVALGAGLSVWLSKFVEKLLFGLPPRDAMTLALAASVLLVTGILAGWLPARRAARLNPTTILRE